MQQPFFIGICGGSGSGKTFLLEALKESFDVNCSICSLDDYYKPKHEQKKDENGEINFDLPTALDTQKLEKDILLLQSGKKVEQVEYHFNTTKSTNIKIIEPAPIIIVEGLFVLEYPFVKNNLDFSIYIKVNESLQLERRLLRDVEQRGYSKEQVLYQWNNHVLPCYQNFLMPHREEADFQFNNNLVFEEELSRLKKQLGQKMVINS